MTVADLAVRTGLSMGMLSETENGNTSAALRTLQILADGISVSLTWFVRRYEERREAVYVKSGEAVVIERAATRFGHQGNLLGYLGANTTGVVMEPYYISLTAQSDVFPTFQHDGVELHYCWRERSYIGTVRRCTAYAQATVSCSKQTRRMVQRNWPLCPRGFFRSFPIPLVNLLSTSLRGRWRETAAQP